MQNNILKNCIDITIRAYELLSNKDILNEQESIILVNCEMFFENFVEEKEFYDYLSAYFSRNNPEILDDELPDSTSDWIGELTISEIIEHLEDFIN